MLMVPIHQAFVIGKNANPRCFKDFTKDAYVQYSNNQKAWMTGYLFAEWLYNFDFRSISVVKIVKKGSAQNQTQTSLFQYFEQS
jgi:hypothetical protein